MNTTSNQNFERSLQQLHGSALESVSADTLTRLRHGRRHAGARPASAWGKRGWWLATACSAVLAVAAALNFPAVSPPDAAPAVPQALATSPYDDDNLLFEESPELYLWLGSDNALAME